VSQTNKPVQVCQNFSLAIAMKAANITLVAVFLAAMADASPVTLPLSPAPPTRNYTSHPEGPTPLRNWMTDIRLTAEQLSGVIDERYRWRNGFYVHPDRAFRPEEYQIINDALYELHQILCIDVGIWPQDSNPTGDYVEIIRGASGSGCWSYVGRIGGRQDLNLQQDGCIYKYVVQHEMIHALGYFHEQSRADRDAHVNILWNNIQEGLAYAFEIEPNTDTFNVPYDTSSIMHYASDAFSNNGQPTILRKDGGSIPYPTRLTLNDGQN